MFPSFGRSGVGWGLGGSREVRRAFDQGSDIYSRVRTKYVKALEGIIVDGVSKSSPPA